ncbi:Translocation protein sec63 [Neolecta irregularis DAH-3]|uniref:Translocation protein sec63 n=1 Tax=Neolecta irregularis (strain DAH-3) TaxID=1198029 RepID=A0A1U7LVB6_NEOID|nr:Translocation protein sec63 [Neolecta irregularis DAH-3]|eukprot:OLL26569.1 Translocation protein sec63 [Neolecta irregularis DAH-3]
MEDLVAHFVELTKAYKALTDDDIRRNFEEFGHPDGKQDFSVGIALPKWIIEGQNSAYVLGLYALLIGVLLPYYVGRWWNGSKQLTKDGIRIRSAETFFRNFSDHIDPGTATDMIALSDEYRVAYRNNGLSELQVKTLAHRADSSLNVKGKDQAWAKKSLALLSAHLNRVQLQSKDLEKDQHVLLDNALRLQRGLLTIALAFGYLQPILTAMNLSQSIIQAIPIGGSPLLQITGITRDIVDKIHGRRPDIQTVDDLMSLEDSERRFLLEDLDDKAYNEAMSVAKQIPLLDVVNSYFKVPGDNIVAPGAIVQFIVRARTLVPGQKIPVAESDLVDKDAENAETHQILSKSKKPDKNEQAHAPLYPKQHIPRYWIFISDAKQDRLIVPPTLAPSVGSQVETMSLQFQVPQSPGVYTFQGYIKSDSYLGTDHILNVQLHIEEASKLQEIVPDDEISEPDEDSIAGQLNHMKGQPVRKSRKTEESSDDDSSSGESEEDPSDSESSDSD